MNISIGFILITTLWDDLISLYYIALDRLSTVLLNLMVDPASNWLTAQSCGIIAKVLSLLIIWILIAKLIIAILRFIGTIFTKSGDVVSSLVSGFFLKVFESIGWIFTSIGQAIKSLFTR